MFVGGISYMTTGNANPVDMLLSLGLGIPALLIIVLSSVTTNVMNLYSASISFVNVWPKAKPWQIIGIGGIVMTGIALIPNLIGHFISFLTIVGSIFVPLIAIMLVDYFLIKKQKVVPEEMLAEDSTSKYWFKGGFNWKAHHHLAHRCRYVQHALLLLAGSWFLHSHLPRHRYPVLAGRR